MATTPSSRLNQVEEAAKPGLAQLTEERAADIPSTVELPLSDESEQALREHAPCSIVTLKENDQVFALLSPDRTVRKTAEGVSLKVATRCGLAGAYMDLPSFVQKFHKIAWGIATLPGGRRGKAAERLKLHGMPAVVEVQHSDDSDTFTDVVVYVGGATQGQRMSFVNVLTMLGITLEPLTLDANPFNYAQVTGREIVELSLLLRREPAAGPVPEKV